jgi:hypothetical protein
VCDLENLKNEEAMTHVGSQRHQKKSTLQSLFYLTAALHVLGITITHLQEHKTTVTTAYATHNTLKSVPTLP